MSWHSLEIHGITADIRADGEGLDLQRARATDPALTVRWLCESATDGQLTAMAAELVREQSARDEAAQNKEDLAEAARALRIARAALVVELAKAEPSKIADLQQRIFSMDAELAMMGAA